MVLHSEQFGIDAIAILHGPGDMPSFFAHELFHIYHRQVMGSRMPDPDNFTWWEMWEEGLATYVSARLNPDRPRMLHKITRTM